MESFKFQVSSGMAREDARPTARAHWTSEFGLKPLLKTGAASECGMRT